MNPKLRALLVVIGTVTAGGGIAFLATPKRDTTQLQLIDAGILDGQPFALVCPERLTDAMQTKYAAQLRPRQKYARIARVAVCFRADGSAGNCFNAAGQLLAGAAASGTAVIVPSLRKRSAGVISEGSADDSEQIRSECVARRCADMPAGFCTTPLVVAIQPSLCAIPDCRTAGVWVDRHAPVACLATGRLGNLDGGPRWPGCNVINPGTLAAGAACLPVECGVLDGDSIVAEFTP